MGKEGQRQRKSHTLPPTCPYRSEWGAWRFGGSRSSSTFAEKGSSPQYSLGSPHSETGAKCRAQVHPHKTLHVSPPCPRIFLCMPPHTLLQDAWHTHTSHAHYIPCTNIPCTHIPCTHIPCTLNFSTYWPSTPRTFALPTNPLKSP